MYFLHGEYPLPRKTDRGNIHSLKEKAYIHSTIDPNKCPLVPAIQTQNAIMLAYFPKLGLVSFIQGHFFTFVFSTLTIFKVQGHLSALMFQSGSSMGLETAGIVYVGNWGKLMKALFTRYGQGLQKSARIMQQCKLWLPVSLKWKREDAVPRTPREYGESCLIRMVAFSG